MKVPGSGQILRCMMLNSPAVIKIAFEGEVVRNNPLKRRPRKIVSSVIGATTMRANGTRTGNGTRSNIRPIGELIKSGGDTIELTRRVGRSVRIRFPSVTRRTGKSNQERDTRAGGQERQEDFWRRASQLKRQSVASELPTTIIQGRGSSSRDGPEPNDWKTSAKASTPSPSRPEKSGTSP